MIPISAAICTRCEVGYTGVIAVECRPYPDAYTGAERCIRYMRAMETIVDIERSNFR
ncbi:MAG: hypothetical protein ACLUFI_09645 [Oscillospiraceae bacterium]